MNDTLPTEMKLEIRVPATPDHTNAGGDIFGGWIMAQADIAGSIPAVRESKGRVATVAVTNFVFHKPVFVGDMVNVYTAIKKIGNTSITIVIEIYVERNPRKIETIKVGEAEIVYVAIDDNGKPRPVNG